jgi:phage FluMu gp28-like protein
MSTTIEFGLPSGSGGLAAGYHSQSIRRTVKEWCQRHQVTVDLELRQHDYRSWLAVTFAREQDLTLFALTWNYRTFMQWQQR